MIFRNTATSLFIHGDIECWYLLPSGNDHTLVGVLRLIDGYWWFVPANVVPLTSRCLHDIAERLYKLNTTPKP